jgi:ammonium transporter Rh
MITRIFKDERHTVNGKVIVHNVLDVEILLNSTLAGGVAMGAAADIIVKPYYAMICGWVTGAVSALGYIYIGPFLKEKINLHDTCGIHNLHAMPGFIGGIIAVIAANKQALVSYGSRYGEVFLRYTEGRTPAQ